MGSVAHRQTAEHNKQQVGAGELDSLK